MKTAFCLLLIFSLAACQKEIQFPRIEPKVAAKVEPVKPPVDLSEFTKMLTENYQYQLTGHYSDQEDLWSNVPYWVKDDAYTFRETGEGWIDANTEQDPANKFFGKEQNWKAYTTENAASLEWVDYHYNETVFAIESFIPNKSFILSWNLDKKKVYARYQIWE